MDHRPLERRHRRAARIALYGALTLAALTAPAAMLLIEHSLPGGARQAWAQIDYPARAEVQLLQEYLRIDTAAPDGDELRAAEFLARELAAAGIPYEILSLGDRRANLVGFVEGELPEALVLHHHIDTDPVPTPDLWKFPPFSGTIDGPWIYGRGAFDMKSVGIAQLTALQDLARSGVKPRRSVIFLATSSEEIGSDLGMRWILRHRPELAERFWAVLTEGGVVEARSGENLKYWGIETQQKRYVDVTLCGNNEQQLEDLRRELVEAPDDREEIRLIPEVSHFLRRYSATRDRASLEAAVADPERLLWDVEAYLGLPPYVRSMFRNELVPFPVVEAPGGGFEMLVKLQLLPDESTEEARSRLLPPWWSWGLSETLYDEHGSAHASPLDHPAYLGLIEVLAREIPSAPSGPFFLPWTATDSRFVRAHGIPSYGFSPFLIFTPDTLNVGQVNERLGLWGFVSGVELYREVVSALVSDNS